MSSYIVTMELQETLMEELNIACNAPQKSNCSARNLILPSPTAYQSLLEKIDRDFQK